MRGTRVSLRALLRRGFAGIPWKRCPRQAAAAPGAPRAGSRVTFACFCGLHGFCRMRRDEEERRAPQETAV